jgi:hypothetical protein
MNPNKPKMALVPLWAIREVARVFAKGLKDGRKPFDWMNIPWTEETALEYRSAVWRHAEEAENATDARTCIEGLAGIITNTIILMYHEPNRVAVRYKLTDPDMENGDGPKWENVNTPQLNKETGLFERPYEDALPGEPLRPKQPGDHAAELLANTPIDPQWHRLNGWIALVNGDGKAHYYDGPNSTACRNGPRIPKGSLRNIYDDPIDADSVCELCAATVIERTPKR